MKKKLIILLILEIIFLTWIIGYYVYAEIENGISSADTPNIENTIGRSLPGDGKTEYKYEHIGRNVRYKGESSATKVIKRNGKDYVGGGGPTIEEVVKRLNSVRYSTYEANQLDTPIDSVLDENPFARSLFCVEYYQGIGYYYGFLTRSANSTDSFSGGEFYDSGDQYVSTYFQLRGQTLTSPRTKYNETSSDLRYDLKSRVITGQDQSLRLDSSVANWGIGDYRESTKSYSGFGSIRSNILYYLTNENTESLYQNLDTGLNNPRETNVYAYSLTFDEKLTANNTNYWYEIGQRALWAETGQSEGSHKSYSTLDDAAYAIDELDKQIDIHGQNPKVSTLTGNKTIVTDISATRDVIGNNKYEPTGSVVYQNKGDGQNYYRIGPFKMSDYAYVYSDYVASYSGRELTVDKKLAGGIVYGELEINGSIVPIGYNEKNGNGFTRTDGKGNAKIVYQDPNGNKTTQGDNKRTGTYFKTPEDYQYPWPNSVFYIDVPVSACGTTGTLNSINFEYRRTYSDGDGWVLSGKYMETEWNVKEFHKGCTTYYLPAGGSCYGDDGAYRQYGYNAYVYSSVATVDGKGGYHRDVACSHIVHLNHSEQEMIDGICENYTTWYSCGCGARHSTWEIDQGKCSNIKINYNSCMCYRDYTHYVSGYFECIHTYEDCEGFTWSLIRGPEPKLSQPMLAVHDAYTKVDLYTRKSPVNVPVATKITVNKYICKVEHTVKDEEEDASEGESYKKYDEAYDSEFENENRKNMSESQKSQADASFEGKNQVKVERGDRIIFKILLENSSGIGASVMLRDVLPEYCIVKYIKIGNSTKNIESLKDVETYYKKVDTAGTQNEEYFISKWIDVPAGGTTQILVVLDATAASGYTINKNEATIVTGNEGYKAGDLVKDDIVLNYVRIIGSKGAVVNSAEISGGEIYKTLKSTEYYRVKSYGVVLDKYISRVEHETTGEVIYQRYLGYKDENDNWITVDSGSAQPSGYTEECAKTGIGPSLQGSSANRDQYNFEQGGKKENPVYVEYGDRVTYDIDIQNTWDGNDLEIDYTGRQPYFFPNYVKVDITDTLPSCYQKGSLTVEYIVRDPVDKSTDPWKAGGNLIQEVANPSIGGLTSGNFGGEKHQDPHGSRGKTTVSVSGNTFSVTDLYINPRSEATLRISFIVDTKETGKLFENNAFVNSSSGKGKCGGGGYGGDLSYEIRNINNYYVCVEYNNPQNKGIRLNSSDFFTLNDYEVSVNKFISDYGEEMLKENVANGFEAYYETKLKEGEQYVRENWSESQKETEPVSAEKYETVEFKIRAYNDAKSDIIGNAYKPATKVRVSNMVDILDIGFGIADPFVTVQIKDSSGNTVKDLGKIMIDRYALSCNLSIPNIVGGEYTVMKPRRIYGIYDKT